jgi:C4-dicarboxylate-specific signal transduction histidine kinase
MTTDNALFFIDANKYLDLYRTARGKLILAALTEQAAYIFVTKHVVSEVKRNTVNETVRFLSDNFKPLTLQTYGVYGHLFGTSEEQSKNISKKMKEIKQHVVDTNKQINALARRPAAGAPSHRRDRQHSQTPPIGRPRYSLR